MKNRHGTLSALRLIDALPVDVRCTANSRRRRVQGRHVLGGTALEHGGGRRVSGRPRFGLAERQVLFLLLLGRRRRQTQTGTARLELSLGVFHQAFRHRFVWVRATLGVPELALVAVCAFLRRASDSLDLCRASGNVPLALSCQCSTCYYLRSWRFARASSSNLVN